MTKQIGDAVVFIDPVGKERPAVVTNVFGSENPSINVAFVADDEGRTDNSGRQLERATSVPHQVNQRAHGNYWR